MSTSRATIVGETTHRPTRCLLRKGDESCTGRAVSTSREGARRYFNSRCRVVGAKEGSHDGNEERSQAVGRRRLLAVSGGPVVVEV